MLTTSLSHSLWEIPTSPVNWPATTKPWLTATLVMDRGTHESYLHTFQAHTAMDFAAHLLVTGGEPVQMLCAVSYEDGWDIRDVVSVHIGKLAGIAVVAVRDKDGSDFCPDAPGLPVSSLNELVLVANLARRQQPRAPVPLASLALNVHYLAAQKAVDAVPAGEASTTSAHATV